LGSNNSSSSGIIRRMSPTFIYATKRGPSGFVEYSVDTHPEDSYRMADGTTLRDFVAGRRFSAFPRSTGSRAVVYKVSVIAPDGTEVSYLFKNYPTAFELDTAMNDIKMLESLYGVQGAAKLLAAEVYSNNASVLFEYIPGKTFMEWHADISNPKFDRVVAEDLKKVVYNGLLAGLQAIHQRGIVHRDVHEKNIWVPFDLISGIPYFFDFEHAVRVGAENFERGYRTYKRPGTPTVAHRQTEDIDYYALGKMFEKYPIADSNIPLRLMEPGLKPANIAAITFRGGKRMRRRARRTLRLGRRRR
jgi:serine/threonine protein kinase